MSICINVEKYGDFDMPHTEVIMLAPESMSAVVVRQATELVQADNRNNRDCDNAIKQLKSLGFIVCMSYSVTVGGNL